MEQFAGTAYKNRKKYRSFLSGAIVFVCLAVSCVMGYKTVSGMVSAGVTTKTEVREPAYSGLHAGAVSHKSYTEGYISVAMTEDKLFLGDLTLVNRSNLYPFPEGADLVSVFDNKTAEYNVRDRDVLVERRVMESLDLMLADFYTNKGLDTINVVSGYRSYDYQNGLYMQSLETAGVEHTSRYIALPGTSEHHTGLAVDFSIYHADTGGSEDYDGAGDYAWITENAWKYGFVKRYSDSKEELTGIWDEPWHFRYVGLPHAMIMEENGYCLEEYIEFLKGYTWDGKHLTAVAGGMKYDIYYCEGLTAYLPRAGECNISGVGDGFIVVIEKQEASAS